MIRRNLKREKRQRASKPVKNGTSHQVSRDTAEGVYKPANTICLLSSLERCTPLKVTEFKSSMALLENGIKGWTINLSYSQVTGHLRAKILMGSFSPFLLPCNRCMIHGLSFSGLHFHLITFSLLLLSDSFVNFLRRRDVRTSTPFMI